MKHWKSVLVICLAATLLFSFSGISVPREAKLFQPVKQNSFAQSYGSVRVAPVPSIVPEEEYPGAPSELEVMDYLILLQ